MARSSGARSLPSWQWVRMKGKKELWRQGMEESRSGAHRSAGAAGEAKGCEQRSGAWEARMWRKP